MTHAFNLRRDQPDLHSQFQDRQDYTERQCFKNNNKQTNKQKASCCGFFGSYVLKLSRAPNQTSPLTIHNTHIQQDGIITSQNIMQILPALPYQKTLLTGSIYNQEYGITQKHKFQEADYGAILNLSVTVSEVLKLIQLHLIS